MTRLAPAGGGGLSAPGRPASARPAFPRLNLLRRALFLWAAPCLALAGGCRSVPPLPPPPSSLAELETRMEALRLRFAIPGMTAAAARGGDLLWAKGFGTADREAGTAASVDTSTGWRLATGGWRRLRLSPTLLPRERPGEEQTRG